MNRKYFGLRPVVFFGLVCLGFLIYLKLNYKMSYETTESRDKLLKKINEFIKTGYKAVAVEGQACKIPYLDLNSYEIVHLIKTNIVQKCNQSKDWVEIDGSTAKISSWAKEKYGDIECTFSDVFRTNDFEQFLGMATTTHTEYNLEESDVVSAYCQSSNKKVWVRFAGIAIKEGFNFWPEWSKILLGVRSDQGILDRTSWTHVPEDSLKLNVLIVGLDSLSHNMWKRKLPKTYKYATKELGGIVLNGYNIVGDGTPQALIPILTGKTELELPETRRKMGKDATYVNVYPFIWNDFRNIGYTTLYSEDGSNVGTFQYRLKGFNDPPVDHYARPFFLEMEPSLNGICYGQLSLMELQGNYVKNMYKVYKDKPKFMFIFYATYSHDSLNYTINADEDLLAFLIEFYQKNYLNNTLLILMSDHGTRFSSFRSSQQGKQEERLPGFIFVFPSWFQNKYPEAYSNFKLNSDRLTTPFDIHETLKSVIHFDGGGMGDKRNRGISLFKEVPLSRTCQDAYIEPHWCSCLEWEVLKNSENIVKIAAAHFIDFINSMTHNYRRFCTKVKLKTIKRSAKLTPNSYLLKFKSSGTDGFIDDMSDKTAVSSEFYQLQLVLSPGDMTYEVTIQYLLRHSKFVIKEKDISRINKYKDMTSCIDGRDFLSHLRKYCYCH